MTLQARQATEKMLKAGFRRSEFSVVTERKHGGYGDAKIRYRCETEKVLSLKDSILEAGLGLKVWRMNGTSDIAIIDASYEMEGVYKLHIIREGE